MGIPVFKMATIGLLPSPLKVAWYRLRGARIGKRVKMAPFSILSAGSIEIGDDCSFGLFCFVTVRGKLRMGKRAAINSMVAIDTGELDIGDDSVIMEQCVVGGMQTPRSRLTIGKRVKIFPYCFINPTEPIRIGDDVGVGGSTYIFTHGTWKNVLDGYPAAFGPVDIQDRVWLPWRVFIMPGVTVGTDTIVGANSTLTKDVPAGSLARGTPAAATEFAAKSLTPEARLSKLHEILTAYAEFARYNGKSSKITSIVDHTFRVETDGKMAVVTLAADKQALAGTHVLIAIDSLTGDARARLDKLGVIWFDVSVGEARFSKLPLALDIYEFLGRYGIRFARD
jgi:acetyltransferase-like isoleucine patch superfamily enzyme